MVDSELQSLSISLFDPQIGTTVSKSSVVGDQHSLVELFKKACADKNFTVIKGILQYSNFIPTEPVDEFGNTILHFILINLDEFGGLPFLQSFLANPQVKKIINARSIKDGVTPAILAYMLKQNQAITMLANAGADVKMPSRDGASLVTATETEAPKMANPAVRPVASPNQPQQSNIEAIKKTLQSFLAPLTRHSEIPETSIGMSASRSSEPAIKINTPLLGGYSNELSTEAFIKGVMNNTLGQSTPQAMSTGGSRAVVVGQRFLNNANEISPFSGGKSDRKKRSSRKAHSPSRTSRKSLERSSETRGSFELGRITDDIHERTVETIKSLMGVDDETARAYKSILYFKVKQAHPEFSGYERAVEMEKTATKAELKGIKDAELSEAMKRRADLKANSASASSDSEKKPARKPKKTDSDVSPSDEGKKSKPARKKSETTSVTSSLDFEA